MKAKTRNGEDLLMSRDRLTPLRRSWNMSRIGSRDTTPERTVRRLLHQLGYRFRLHMKKLPGRPDIVLPKYRTAIFVHGCFWHQHPGCIDCSRPKAHSDYWGPKLLRNVKRDAANQEALRERGWHVIVIWECESKRPESVIERLAPLTAIARHAYGTGGPTGPINSPRPSLRVDGEKR